MHFVSAGRACGTLKRLSQISWKIQNHKARSPRIVTQPSERASAASCISQTARASVCDLWPAWRGARRGREIKRFAGRVILIMITGVHFRPVCIVARRPAGRAAARSLAAIRCETRAKVAGRTGALSRRAAPCRGPAAEEALRANWIQFARAPTQMSAPSCCQSEGAVAFVGQRRGASLSKRNKRRASAIISGDDNRSEPADLADGSWRRARKRAASGQGERPTCCVSSSGRKLLPARTPSA